MTLKISHLAEHRTALLPCCGEDRTRGKNTRKGLRKKPGWSRHRLCSMKAADCCFSRDLSSARRAGVLPQASDQAWGQAGAPRMSVPLTAPAAVPEYLTQI